MFNIFNKYIFESDFSLVNNADYTVILANSQAGLQNLTNAITDEGDAFGFKINTEK